MTRPSPKKVFISVDPVPIHIGQYQVNILRKLRDINVDYHHVGWYQSTYLSSHVTKEFLESHVRYQLAIQESVVLIYGMLMCQLLQYPLGPYRNYHKGVSTVNFLLNK